MRLIFVRLIFAVMRPRKFFTLNIYSGKIGAREKYSNYGISMASTENKLVVTPLLVQ